MRSPAPRSAASDRAWRLGLVAIAAVVDREGRLWPPAAPGAGGGGEASWRAAVERATTDFDRLYLLPFAARRGLAARQRAALRRDLMHACGRLLPLPTAARPAALGGQPADVRRLLALALQLPPRIRRPVAADDSAEATPPAAAELLAGLAATLAGALDVLAGRLQALAAGRAAEDRKLARRRRQLWQRLRQEPDFPRLGATLEAAVWRWGSAARELFAGTAAAPLAEGRFAQVASDRSGRPVRLEVTHLPARGWQEAAARFLLDTVRSDEGLTPGGDFACSLGPLELCVARPYPLDSLVGTARLALEEIRLPQLANGDRFDTYPLLSEALLAIHRRATVPPEEVSLTPWMNDLAEVIHHAYLLNRDRYHLAAAKTAMLAPPPLEPSAAKDRLPVQESTTAAWCLPNLATTAQTELRDIVERLKRLRQLLAELRAQTAVLGPAPLKWRHRSPYCHGDLQRLGVTPAASIEAIRAIATQERMAATPIGLVHTPEARLEHDVFLYRLTDPARVAAYLEVITTNPWFAQLEAVPAPILHGETALFVGAELARLLAPAHLEEALREDAVVVLIALGDTAQAIELGRRLSAGGSHGWLHHNLALLYLYESERRYGNP